MPSRFHSLGVLTAHGAAGRKVVVTCMRFHSRVVNLCVEARTSQPIPVTKSPPLANHLGAKGSTIAAHPQHLGRTRSLPIAGKHLGRTPTELGQYRLGLDRIRAELGRSLPRPQVDDRSAPRPPQIDPAPIPGRRHIEPDLTFNRPGRRDGLGSTPGGPARPFARPSLRRPAPPPVARRSIGGGGVVLLAAWVGGGATLKAEGLMLKGRGRLDEG